MTSVEPGGRAGRRDGGRRVRRSGGAWATLTVVFIAACIPGPRVPAPANPLANVPRAWPLFDGAEEVRAERGPVVKSSPSGNPVSVLGARRPTG